MLFFSKRKRIIKRAIANTVTAFDGRTPEIYEHFFYGEFDLAPQNLVVWYLFETDAELENAKSSGLCNELEELTVKNLISSGYPKEAFELTETDFSAFSADRIAVQDGAEEDIRRVFDSLENRKAMISFTTKEDIDKKANGDYHLYFQ